MFMMAKTTSFGGVELDHHQQQQQQSLNRKTDGYWGSLLHHHDHHEQRLKLTTDRLSELPEDILLSILCTASFSIKEVAQMSLFSRRWRNLWKYFPLLFFTHDSRVAREESHACVVKDLSNLVKLMQQHVGPVVDELRIDFYLAYSCPSFFKKWLDFAHAKQIKNLCFKGISSRLDGGVGYNFCIVLPSLRSLSLENIHITSEVLESLLYKCQFLENISICRAQYLTAIRAPSSVSLPLKHLEMVSCWRMETIDISAPNLLSFKYVGPPLVDLHIRNAALLSKVTIGNAKKGDRIDYALRSLSCYFPQLEYLCLLMSIVNQLNLGQARAFPTLEKLKHLTLNVTGRSYQTLIGWIYLIESSPSIQKLTLEVCATLPMTNRDLYPSRIYKPNKHPLALKCLKSLKIVDFEGGRIDLEIANYVIERSTALEEVILFLRPKENEQLDEGVVKIAMELKKTLSCGVQFHLRNVKEYSLCDRLN